jgi:hypothetical protein
MNSALDIYKSIAAGSAQINPFSDYFQEDEDSMKTQKPIFEGKGITRDVHVQMPFSCDSNSRDQGCYARFPKDQIDMINHMEAEGIPSAYNNDMYDYSKGVFFDYSRDDYQKFGKFMTKCDPLKENTTECLSRIFECGGEEWEACSRYIDFCPSQQQSDVNTMCKYNLNNELIGKYVAPQITLARTQPFCKLNETTEECLSRYECTDTNCALETCKDDPNYVCKPSTGQRFFFSSPVPVTAAESPSVDVVSFDRSGVGEFFSK